MNRVQVDMGRVLRRINTEQLYSTPGQARVRKAGEVVYRIHET